MVKQRRAWLSCMHVHFPLITNRHLNRHAHTAWSVTQVLTERKVMCKVLKIEIVNFERTQS